MAFGTIDLDADENSFRFDFRFQDFLKRLRSRLHDAIQSVLELNSGEVRKLFDREAEGNVIPVGSERLEDHREGRFAAIR